MIHPNSRLRKMSGRLWSRTVLNLAFFLSITSLAACSSVCQKTESADRVLDEQSAVLTKLKVERADPRVAAKLQADPDLSASEEHLSQVIERLIRSNSALRSAL